MLFFETEMHCLPEKTEEALVLELPYGINCFFCREFCIYFLNNSCFLYSTIFIYAASKSLS